MQLKLTQHHHHRRRHQQSLSQESTWSPVMLQTTFTMDSLCCCLYSS